MEEGLVPLLNTPLKRLDKERGKEMEEGLVPL